MSALRYLVLHLDFFDLTGLLVFLISLYLTVALLGLYWLGCLVAGRYPRRPLVDRDYDDYWCWFQDRYGCWQKVARPDTHGKTRLRRGDKLAHRLLRDD